MLEILIKADPAQGRLPWYQVSYREAMEMDLRHFNHLVERQYERLEMFVARNGG